MLTDVHDSPEVREVQQGFMNGVDFSEVLYVDDMVIFSEFALARNTLLQAFEAEGCLYGMKKISENVNSSTSVTHLGTSTSQMARNEKGNMKQFTWVAKLTTRVMPPRRFK